MLFKKSLLVFLIISSTLFSQKIGVWKNYTNLDNVMDVAPTQNGFWIATTGGVGYYSYTLGEYEFFLTNSEGLSNQNITAIDVDSEGRIWLGMQNGMLDIYDPNTNTTIPIKDIFESPNTSKKITDILIIDNIAYVSTEFGLSMMNTKNLAFISSTSKFGDLPSLIAVNSVYVSDRIYVSTDFGIAIQKMGSTNLVAPESWTSFRKSIDINANKIYCTIKYNNELLAGTDKGLFKFDGVNWNNYLFTEAIFDLDVVDGNLYVLKNNALTSFDGTNATTIYSSNVELRKFEKTSVDEYLIASLMGTIKATNDGSEVLLPNGPVSNSFQSLAVDGKGALWVATGKDEYGDGFMKFHDGIWTNYNTTTYPELPNNTYHNVSAQGSEVFLSNWGSGLTIEKDETFSHLNANNSKLVGIPDHENYIVMMNVQRDRNGDLWFFNHASADGKPIIQLTPDSTWYHYLFPYSPITGKSGTNYILDGIIDENNTKWFNVHGRGLYYLNERNTPSNETDDVWGHLSSSNGLNSENVNAIALDNRGELWIGTAKGMNVLANTASPNSLITSVFALRQQSITSIAVDPLNNKWVGTYQGLFVMSPDGSYLLEQYDSKNSPLPTDNITSIAIDEKTGIVYIGTSFGLSTLTTSSVGPKQDFDEIITYPSPFRIGTHQQVTFDGLVENSSIKILSISGKLIRELDTPGGRISFWDGKDENGKFVASGIYLLVAFDEEADKITTSKFAVIR